MQIGIVGLPRSGKTTIFNAVTKGKAMVVGYSDRSNVGTAKVPDERLDILKELYKPRRTVAAEVTYTDIPPPPDGFGKTRGIGGEYLNALQSSDALLIAVRAFENPSVPHIDETIDPFRDTENMLMEIVFSDLEILDRRLNKIEENLKGSKANERDKLNQEKLFLQRIKTGLESGIAVRDQELSVEELRRISGFGFLSTKPIIIVLNVGEQQLALATDLERKLQQTISANNIGTAVICAQIEMDLAQMDSEDERLFRRDLATGESSLNKMIRISYRIVDRISFFTVGEDEVRAWEISRNTIAHKAAGKIHSDLERGFIRAEVISYQNLVESGGFSEARRKGIVRQEGKDYIVQDGEIMHVLFNV